MKDIEEHLKKYYTNTIDNHGCSAMGVGWKSEEAQEKRFLQLSKIITENNNFSINDLGCGTGHLLNFLVKHTFQDFLYRGYDVLDTMLSLAVHQYGSFRNASFFKVNGADELTPADYTVASGIFNLKYAVKEKEWLSYILQTLEHMNRCSKKGFAFNMLTTYSDKELMQETLYYADPLFMFDYCKKNFSKNIALLHDYHEYDFTILVRK